MSTTADGREIYVLGVEGDGNREVVVVEDAEVHDLQRQLLCCHLPLHREVVVVEDAEVHDLPATAEYTYASDLTKFPYAS